MRLRVQFGLIDTKEVFWYRPLEQFPQLIRFIGKNYEWVVYDTDPSGQVDTILVYSELPTHDPNFGVSCPTWNELFGDSNAGCECGAAFSSFNWDHMRFCKKWTKW